MKKILVGLMVMAVVCSMSFAESQYASDLTTNTAINLGAHSAGWRVKAINAESGANGARVQVYDRTAASPYKITGTQGTTTTNLYFTNTSTGCNTNDILIYQKTDGSVSFHTVAGPNTATNIIVTPAVSGSVSTNLDYVYELNQIGSINVGATNANYDVLRATLNLSGDSLFQTRADSPIRIYLNSVTNSYLSVTAE